MKFTIVACFTAKKVELYKTKLDKITIAKNI